MGKKKWKYKIIYPEYRECDKGMDIRIRPLKLYDENGFAPQYRLEGKHSWDQISSFITALELDLLHLRAEFKEKAKELHKENRQKERVTVKKRSRKLN